MYDEAGLAEENRFMMTDHSQIEALIVKVALADRDAFSALYDMTSAKLFSVCLKVLNDQQAAEDALQDSYIKIWNKADQYHSNGMSPMTWLITIARNTSIDHLRNDLAKQNIVDKLPELVDEMNDPEAYSMALSRNAKLELCLEELEDDKAEAVCGAYLYGFSYAELAKRYRIPLNTVRTWLRRSLSKLKRCLSND